MTLRAALLWLSFWVQVVPTALWAAPLSLTFPGNAARVIDTVTRAQSYDMPTGPWRDGGAPTSRIEGDLTRQVWQVAALDLSTLQLLAPLRQQLLDQGFDVLFDCDAASCGGFDFRFGTDVAAPPDMFVDLGNFRFLASQRGEGDQRETLTLFVSTTAQTGYVQVIRVGAQVDDLALSNSGTAPIRAPEPSPVATGTASVAPQTDATDFATRLDNNGHVVLRDLTFDSGSAQLATGQYASLAELAEYLLANPGRTVALVGHTDASGSLAGNIDLSKRRAGSVLERLVSNYGIPRSQLDAQGMGYLAPIASNLSPEGREVNRRVEVIVTSIN